MNLDVRAPDVVQLVDAWDAGLMQHPIDRALTVVAAFTGLPTSVLADRTIGERDAVLLEIRRLLAGDRIAALTNCQKCAEPNEFRLDAGALPRTERSQDAATISVRTQDRSVRARLPTSRDLAAVVECDDADVAARTLIARCLIDQVELDSALAGLIEDRMAEVEGLAGLEISFTCSACDAANRVPFDIASFVWSELDTRMRRLLDDVDALAFAYGWAEADILALSDRRRALYVELARR
jgi:hypothetical protein